MECTNCGYQLGPLDTQCRRCGWIVGQVSSSEPPPKPAEPSHILCPQCGTSVALTQAYCPNCGTRLSATWPPTIAQRFLPPLEKRKRLTPFPWLDVVIGVAVTIGSFWIHWGVVVIAVLGIAFSWRFPYVSRGIGCALVISVIAGVILTGVAILGILKTCFHR